MFRYITDKDLFESYHKRYLTKRLISGYLNSTVDSSAKDDVEKRIIAKLRTECGYQFTTKLEGMFNDIKNSKQINISYKSKSTDENGLELNLLILTSGFWPLARDDLCNIPDLLRDNLAKFTEYYNQVHSGRKLSWLFNIVYIFDLKFLI